MARLVYDGDCGFCRRSVRFIEARAGPRPPQMVPADEAALEPALAGRTPHTILLISQGRTYEQSAAAVRVLWRMRGLWPLAGTLLWLVPKPLRDAGYRWVARNRHRF